MRRFILMVLGILVVGAGAFAGYVAMQPEDYRISRSIAIAAPPAKVFPHVNNFHKWDNWSPWAKLDPNAKNSFEGPESGKGAIMKWSGNDKVGEGSMTILDTKADENIHIKLAFLKPMEDSCDVEFDFKGEGEKTTATWIMYGKNGFVGRVFCTLMGFEKMMNEKFDEGLASLKKTVEAEKSTADTK